MTARQLDLFSEGAASAEHCPSRAMSRRETSVPTSLDDAALVEAIPDRGIANTPELAAEAGRRRLAAAVPALESLCWRFVGFGSDRTIPEQLAAMEVLAMIGGTPARQAIACIIVSRVVQGPGLVSAIAAAVHSVAVCRPTSPLKSCGMPIPAFVPALAGTSARHLRPEEAAAEEVELGAIQVAVCWHLVENASVAFLVAIRRDMGDIRCAFGQGPVD